MNIKVVFCCLLICHSIYLASCNNGYSYPASGAKHSYFPDVSESRASQIKKYTQASNSNQRGFAQCDICSRPDCAGYDLDDERRFQLTNRKFDIKDWEMKFKELFYELSIFTEKIEVLKTELQEREEQVVQRDDRIGATEKKLDDCKVQLNEKEQKVIERERQLQDQAKKLKQQQEEIKRQEEITQTQEKELRKQERQIDELEETVEKLRKVNDDQTRALKRSQETVQTLEEEIRRLKGVKCLGLEFGDKIVEVVKKEKEKLAQQEEAGETEFVTRRRTQQSIVSTIDGVPDTTGSGVKVSSSRFSSSKTSSSRGSVGGIGDTDEELKRKGSKSGSSSSSSSSFSSRRTSSSKSSGDGVPVGSSSFTSRSSTTRGSGSLVGDSSNNDFIGTGSAGGSRSSSSRSFSSSSRSSGSGSRSGKFSSENIPGASERITSSTTFQTRTGGSTKYLRPDHQHFALNNRDVPIPQQRRL